MVRQKIRNLHNNTPVTKQINVTNLTACQKHNLFIDYLAQAGFTSFTKKKIGEQTYYTFTYKGK